MTNVDHADPLARPVRRLLTIGTWVLAVGVWLAEFQATKGLRAPSEGYDWLPPLISGPVLALLLAGPRRVPVQRRAWVLAAGSLVMTAGLLIEPGKEIGWGALEVFAMLVMLVRTTHEVRPRTAVATGAVLVTAMLVAPARLANPDALPTSFLLTFAAGGAIGLGCYLRLRDWRRARTLESVRQGERMELARDLHDHVAHHVTGIIVQANAARAIRETAPEQIDPILENIQQAGTETLESMRRLVRVLREVDDRPRRSGELAAELGKLVSGFGGDVRLSVAAGARTARLAPEVETSVHRLVQEALTNVRRHAPGATAEIRVDVADDRLTVEVRNSAAATVRSGSPVGGRGGFGLAGLRERVEAVDGTLEAGARPGGGWRVAATFPVLAMAGSSA